MKVAANCVVSVDYSLHLGDGAVVDSSSDTEPLTYLHGSGQIIPGLEKQLEGMNVGQKKDVIVQPADGYGDRDPDNVQEISRDHFGDRELNVGDEFVAVDDEENEIPVRVEKVAGDTITVDFNHPLAGKTLHFSVTIKEVRAATADELAHGHAHGADEHDPHH